MIQWAAEVGNLLLACIFAKSILWRLKKYENNL